MIKKNRQELIEFTLIGGSHNRAPSLTEIRDALVKNEVDLSTLGKGDFVKIEYMGSAGTQDPLNQAVKVTVSIGMCAVCGKHPWNSHHHCWRPGDPNAPVGY